MMKRYIIILSLICNFFSIATSQEKLKVEYFFDTDPGYGKAVALNSLVGEGTLSFDISNLKPGNHQLCIRAQENNGRWSPTICRTFYIYKITPKTAASVEYFFDTDPGYGQGFLRKISTGETTLTLDLNGLSEGAHQFCIRSQDDVGNWTPITARTIYILKSKDFNIKNLEYYFDDNDPGKGNATQISLPAEWNKEFTFDIDINKLSVGDHYLSVRGLDQDNNWFTISSEPFTINNAVGIRTVTFDIPIKIKTENDKIVLSKETNIVQSDYDVEVLGLNGSLISSAIWFENLPEISLKTEEKIVIIKITEKVSGKKLVRRIMMH